MTSSYPFLSGLAAVLSALATLCAGTWPAQAQLNDTGVNRYSDGNTFQSSEPSTYPGQDPRFGRDAAAAAGVLPKVGGGAKGFDFTKLDSNGGPLPADATAWDCVHDNNTNLDWEMKTDDGGLRDKDWRYSWYSTDNSSNGGNPGTQSPSGNPGVCGSTLTYCNTQEYAAAINQSGLCGHADWRLPTIEELRSIVDYGIVPTGPTIDVSYFPNTVKEWFWSSSVYAAWGPPNYAWLLDFYFGYDDFRDEGNAEYVRLVRGGQ